MMIYLIALLVGVIAGLRAMTAPAVVAWGAHLGVLPVAGTPLAFMASPVAAWLFTVLALGELVTDKLPRTPSRKVPLQFGGRIVSGGFCGAVVTIGHDGALVGIVAGVIGAVIGTLGGAAARGALARALGRDLPAALIEDAIAVLGGIGLVAALS
jgi:uncharacterized membrane protein